MNLFKLAIAAFSATNLMTTFSYLFSAGYKKLFREPVMMDFILQGLGISLKGRWHKVRWMDCPLSYRFCAGHRV